MCNRSAALSMSRAGQEVTPVRSSHVFDTGKLSVYLKDVLPATSGGPMLVSQFEFGESDHTV